MKFKKRRFYFNDGSDVVESLKAQITALEQQVEALKGDNDDDLRGVLVTAIEQLQAQVKELMKKPEPPKPPVVEPPKPPVVDPPKPNDDEMPPWYRAELKKQEERRLQTMKASMVAQYPDYADEVNEASTEAELERLVKTIKKAKEKEESLTDEKLLAKLKEKGEDWQNQQGLSYKKKPKPKKEEKISSFFNKFKNK